MSTVAEHREPSTDWSDTSEVDALRDALERERLTTARLRRDLEQVRRLSSDLIVREQAARTAAETANRSKDEFLATLSHEMRTPLNVVLGIVWRLLNRAMDPDATRRALETIDRNTRLQAQLMEDLLDVSRIITGKLKLHMLPLDLRTIVGESIDAVKSAADAKGIAIELAIDAESTRVEGDPLRLQQVVWNLLSNAVKFTPTSGRISVTIRRAGDALVLAVSDTGTGIAPELIPYVFDRFRQGDSTSTRKYGGLGLGLSIVRHLVELHGGTVSASSDGEGCGATFELTLPIRGGEARIERRAAHEPRVQVPTLRGVRVLVAEDKTDVRTQLHAALDRYGATVVSVSTMTAAVDVVNEAPPDVLLADVHMVNQRVEPLLERLRAIEQSGPPVPAIAVSEYARTDDRVQALIAGFKGYISAPFNAPELAAIVFTLTRKPASTSWQGAVSVAPP